MDMTFMNDQDQSLTVYPIAEGENENSKSTTGGQGKLSFSEYLSQQAGSPQKDSVVTGTKVGTQQL